MMKWTACAIGWTLLCQSALVMGQVSSHAVAGDPSSGTIPTSEPTPAEETATQPADDDNSDIPALQILPPPTNDDEITKRLILVQKELGALHVTSQPTSAPTSSPADDPAYRLVDSLRQYQSSLEVWQKARAGIERLKSPETLNKLAADLDAMKKQQENYKALQADTAYVWSARVEEIEKLYNETNVRLQELLGLQATREQQLAGLLQQKVDNQMATKTSLDTLKKYLTTLPEKMANAKGRLERHSLLLHLRALQWNHNLHLLQVAMAPDLTTQLELAQQQGSDRAAAMNKYVEALRDYRIKLEQVHSQSEVDFAISQLARKDLPPHIRSYWEIRQAIAQGIVDFQRFDAEIRDLYPQTELDQLESRIQRVQWYLGILLESIDSRSGQAILETYHRTENYLKKSQELLSRLKISRYQIAEKLRAAYERRDSILILIRFSNDRLQQQISTLQNNELIRARELQAGLTSDINALRSRIDSVMANMESSRDRLKKAIPLQDELIGQMMRDRGKLYRAYLTVPGRSLLWPDWPRVVEEWRALRDWNGKPVDDVRTTMRTLITELAAIPLRQSSIGAILVLLIIILARRSRKHLQAWIRRKEATFATIDQPVPSAEASVVAGAAVIRAASRLQIQLARLVMRTALVIWPLAALFGYLFILDISRESRWILEALLAFVPVSLLIMGSISVLFDAHRPALRIIQCSQSTAGYHRRWLRLIGYAAIVSFPLPIITRIMNIFPSITDLWSDTALLLILFLTFMYMSRRRMFFDSNTTQRPYLLSVIYYRLYPVLPITLAVAMGFLLAGYAALVDHLLHGIVLTIGLLAVSKILRGVAAGWTNERVADHQRSDEAINASAQPGLHPMLLPAMQIARLAILLGALVLVLSVWGVSLADIQALLAYKIMVTAKGALTPWRILAGTFVIALGLFISRALRIFLQTDVFPQVSNVDRGTQAAICLLLHYSLIALSVYIALHVACIDLGGLTILFGTLGLGLGLGLQPLFINFISGLMILFERQVKVGDLIEVNNQPGEVTAISMRSIRIRSFDNVEIVIPNADFITGHVVNWTLSDSVVRAKIEISVAYGTDVQLVRKLLLDIAHKHPKVLAHPASEVWFKDFGASSLDFVLVCWFANPSSRGEFTSQIRFEIERVFRENKIDIPFPQRSITWGGDKPIPVELRMPTTTDTAPGESRIQ